MSPNTDPVARSVWVRPPRSRKGQPTLSREQIVSAAIELLDAEGLDGLSMRRLGAKLGSGATSVYWYVASKDELLELVIDEVMGEVEIPDPDEVGWRAAADAFARGFRSTILRHTWITGLFGTMLFIGPNVMRMSDRAIAMLTAAGFSGSDLAHASSLLVSHVIGSAAVDAASHQATAGKNANDVVAQMESHVERVAADYPHYYAWWRENKNMDLETYQEVSFGFGLERLLDGLEAWLGRTE